jgi:hypothetical protein
LREILTALPYLFPFLNKKLLIRGEDAYRVPEGPKLDTVGPAEVFPPPPLINNFLPKLVFI